MVLNDCIHLMLENSDPEKKSYWLHDSFNSSTYTMKVESSVINVRKETSNVCSDTSKVKLSVKIVYFFNIIISNEWKQDKKTGSHKLWLFISRISRAVIRPLQNKNKNIKDTLILWWKAQWESITTNLSEKCK